MTRHFHALPITPDATLRELKGMSFLVSHATTAKHQIGLVDGIAEEVRLDCGAFSHYNALLSQGLTADQIDEAQLAPRRWDAYYEWCEQWCARPTTRAIIPDVINAPGQIQDALLKEWPLPKWKGIPVYHIHLPTDRLLRLTDEYPLVAIGSSGEFWEIGSDLWHARMGQLFDEISAVHGNYTPPLHGLRMMEACEKYDYPLADADSSNVGQNHHRGRRKDHPDQGYLMDLERHPARTALEMARRINGYQCPARWRAPERTKELIA